MDVIVLIPVCPGAFSWISCRHLGGLTAERHVNDATFVEKKSAIKCSEAFSPCTSIRIGIQPRKKSQATERAFIPHRGDYSGTGGKRRKVRWLGQKSCFVRQTEIWGDLSTAGHFFPLREQLQIVNGQMTLWSRNNRCKHCFVKKQQHKINFVGTETIWRCRITWFLLKKCVEHVRNRKPLILRFRANSAMGWSQIFTYLLVQRNLYNLLPAIDMCIYWHLDVVCWWISSHALLYSRVHGMQNRQLCLRWIRLPLFNLRSILWCTINNLNAKQLSLPRKFRYLARQSVHAAAKDFLCGDFSIN